jgi:hypothetical protein
VISDQVISGQFAASLIYSPLAIDHCRSSLPAIAFRGEESLNCRSVNVKRVSG